MQIIGREVRPGDVLDTNVHVCSRLVLAPHPSRLRLRAVAASARYLRLPVGITNTSGRFIRVQGALMVAAAVTAEAETVALAVTEPEGFPIAMETQLDVGASAVLR